MAEFQIKGDLSGFNEDQLNVICKVLEELNFKGKDVSIEALGKAGDNFASDVRVIIVKVNDDEEFRIVVKVAPKVTLTAISNISVILFNNEITMYNEMLPLMNQLQKNAGYADKDLFKYAKCFGANRERQQEILLLEDLTKYNYTMLDKYKPLSNEYIRLILSKLADYHSLSYVMKEKQPEKFAEFAKTLIDMNSAMDTEEYRQGFKVMGESFNAIFDNEKYKNVVKKTFNEESARRVKQLQEADAGSKYSVIVHGDTWTNNILFQIENDVPTDCVLIDYQIVRESLPVLDILYLFFNCTDYATRAKHYYEWMDHYHSQLEKSLFNFGLRVNNVYPRDQLDSDILRYSGISLCFALFASSLLLRKNDESATIKETMSETEDINVLVNQMKISDTLANESVLKIKERVEGLIDSCYDFGFLKEA